MRTKTILLFCVYLFSLSLIASVVSADHVRVTKFAEVQITLDENFTLTDAQALPLALGNEPKVSDDGQLVIVQIPALHVQQLVEAGNKAQILRRFIFVEPLDNADQGIANSEISTQATVTVAEDYEFEDAYPGEFLPSNGSWIIQGLNFQGFPSNTITHIEVYCEVRDALGLIYVQFSNEDDSIITGLEDGALPDAYGNYEGDWDLTEYAGEPLNQIWWLWVAEVYGYGSGEFHYWSIKLYYEPPGGYCSAQSLSCDYEYISNVQVGTINNSSGCTQYSDYTHLSTEMEIGTAYPITVTSTDGWSNDECGIWVDWDQNEDFYDAGEQIAVSGNPGTGPYAATITPPGDANLGETRMRIRLVDGDYDDLDACGSSSYGEVEDYTITVTSGGPQTRIYGKKWHDLDDNGQIDGGEPALSGWTIFIDEDHDGQIDTNDITTTTDIQGNYEFTALEPNQYYTVSEVDQAGWINTYPGAGGIHYHVRLEDGNETEANFGNYQLHNCDINGHKFYDANNNGVWDTGEQPLSGWEIYIDENENGQWDTGEPKTTTNASGYYEFTNLAPGYYNIMEVPQPNWFQTYPGLTSGRLWAVDAAVDEVPYIIEFDLNTMTVKKHFNAPSNSVVYGYCAFAAGPSTLFYCPLKYASSSTADSLYFEIDPNTGSVVDQGVFEMPENEIAWNCTWHKGILYVTSVEIPYGDPWVTYLNRYDAFTKELISRDPLPEGYGDDMAADPYKDLLLSNIAVPWTLYEINPDTAGLVKTIEQHIPLKTSVAYTRGVLYRSFWGAADEMQINHREDGSQISLIDIQEYISFDTLAGGIGVPGGHRVWIGKHDIQANFGNRPDSEGKFSGTKYEDLNGNGKQDANEPGLAGIQVYLDLDGDMKPDEQEPTTVTDANGNWLIDDLSYGRYFIREVLQKGYTCTEPSLGWIDSIEVNQPRDIIFDDLRNLLYISIAAGTIERFDLNTNQFLSPVTVGGSPHGMDITADYSNLYVADTQLSDGNGVVHKINLNTQAVTDLAYTVGTNEDSSYDIAIGSEGIALFTASYSGSGSVPLYVLNTDTDMITALPDVMGQTTIDDEARLVRSYDRSKIWLINNSSNGWVVVYDAPGDEFNADKKFYDYLNESPLALNYDGSMAAVQLDDHCRIVDSNFNMIMGLDDSRMGAEFDPEGIVFYQFQLNWNRLFILDTITWELLENCSTGLAKLNYEKFRRGETAITADGRIIAVTDPNYIALHRKEYYKLALPGRNIGGYDFGNKPALCGDIDKDRDVDGLDLARLCEDWLCNELTMDIAPIIRDQIVSFIDWARFADAWLSKKGQAKWDALCDVAPAGGDDSIDVYDLVVLIDEWLLDGMVYDSDVAGADGPDGFVNMFDYACLAGNWGIDEGIIEYDEDFETGDFTNLLWVHGGDGPWTIDSSESFEGSYNAKSGDVPRYDTSILSTTVTCGDGYVYFMLKNGDGGTFRFYIDQEYMYDCDWDMNWSLVMIPVTAGPHSFEWKYTVEGFGIENAWIDAIRFPPVSD